MSLPRPHPGFLLVIEGIDGAGKTTQAQRLAAWFESQHRPVLRTREPTNGPWGRKLRESAVTKRLSLADEVAAFLNDRREHVEQEIGPALKAGKIVILDRYYFSNMAYQGARGYDVRSIMEQNEAFAPQPDLLVLMDVDPESGLQRVHNRGSQADLFENIEALKRVRAIFLSIDKPYLLKLDAAQPPERITQEIIRACQMRGL